MIKTKRQRDNIHMSFRTIDGYNKWLNFYFSPREPGKSDTMWWEKIYCKWLKDKKPWGYLVRQSVEITESAILDIENTLNKWSIEPITFIYTKGTFKDGVVDIYILTKNGEENKKELFIRITSLSIPLRRLKLAKIPNIGGIFMDEYIINPLSGEKYIPDEFFKIKELYTTWRREFEGKGVLKMYFCANPYSLFNPIFVGLNIDISALRKDEYKLINGHYKLIPHILVGDTYAIEWGVLHPLLKAKLLEDNPLYQFDEVYNNYALEGMAVNDKNIRLGTFPKNYFLKFIFKHNNKFIGVYENRDYDENNKFFVKFTTEFSTNRTIYCYEFSELIERSVVMSLEERNKLYKFKDAFRRRAIVFEDINCYYFIEEIYKNI